MPSADYTLREVDASLVVEIIADSLLGVIEVNRIGSSLNALVKQQPRNIVLDLGKVRYAGSAALGMLLALTKQLKESGARLVLTGTQHLETLLKVSRTFAVFETAPDVPGALALLNK